MDYKGKKQRKKRILAATVAVIIIASMLLSIIAPFIQIVNAASLNNFVEPMAVNNKDFEMKAEIGFENKYIVSSTTPFRITVTNKGNNFDGEIQIKIKTYDYEYSKTYNIYYLDANLPSGASKEFYFEIPVHTLEKRFLISLTDKNGKTIYSKYINVKALDPETPKIAFLSKNYDSLTYFNKDVEFNKENFPTSYKVLEGFDAIVINDFDTKDLTAENKSALSKWIENGGTLLLGTGYNSANVLDNLNDITGISYNGSVNIKVSEFLKSFEIASNSDKNVEVVDLNVPDDSVSLLQIDGIDLGHAFKKGKGKIVVYAFDLGQSEIAAIGQNTLLFNVLDYTDTYDGNGTYYAPYYDSSSSIPFLQTTGMYVIFVMIFVYVIFVGPILYIILKKRKRLEKGWIIIPSVSISLMIVIYLIGYTSMYRNNFISTFGQLTANAGYTNAEGFITSSIQSQKKGDINFKIDKKYDFVSVDNYIYSDEEMPINKIYCDNDKTDITFLNTSSWDKNSVSASVDIDLGGSIDTDLNFTGDSIKGKIYNNTLQDLYDFVIQYENNLMRLGDIPAGKSIDVNFNLSGINNYYDIYEFTREAFGFSGKYDLQEVVKEGKYSKEEAFTIGQRVERLRNSYNMYYNNGVNIDTEGLKLILYAFNEENILSGEKYVNNKKAYEFNDNIYIIGAKAGFKTTNGKFEIPFGVLKPYNIYVADGSYDDSNIYTYGSSEIEVEFNIPKYDKIEFFAVEWENAMLAEESEIFNYTTGEFETLKSRAYYADSSDYLNDGVLKLRKVVDNEDTIAIPEIRVGGEE